MDGSLAEAVGIVVCLAVASFFSLCDAVVTTYGVARAEEYYKRGQLRLRPLAQAPHRTRYGIRAGKLLSLLGLGVLIGETLLTHPLSWLWIAMLFVASVTVVETIPRALSTGRSRRLVEPLLYMLRPWFWLMQPLTWALVALHRQLGPDAEHSEFEEETVSEADLALLVDVGAKQGSLTELKGRILHSAFEFGDTIVREVMVPRPDIISCESDDSLEEVVRLAVEHGHSRIPVYGPSHDGVVGVLYAKDLLRYVGHDDSSVDLMDLLREPFFVPDTLPLNAMFKEFQHSRVHIALVVDEFGTIAGLITLEDIIEEFFGEIQDEYDSEEAQLEVLSEGHLIADGRVSIDEVGDYFDVQFPDDADYDTLGGFVIAQLGKVPDPGTQAEAYGLSFRVTGATEKRVTRVEVLRLAEAKPIS